MSNTENKPCEQNTSCCGVVEFIKEFYVVLIFGTFFLLNMFLPLLFLPEGNIRWVYGLFSGIVASIAIILLVAYVKGQKISK